MDTEKATQELHVIRQLMERPIRFSTMSGLSGIWAGATALLGVALDLYVSSRPWPRRDMALWINGGVWCGIFAAAFAGVWLLTRLRERKQGMPAWSGVKTRILMTILPLFLAAVGLTAIILMRWCVQHSPASPAQLELVPAIWMLFYGAALWQLGEFSPREVRGLGVAFLLAGLVAAAAFQDVPYLALGVTFGGFHLVYGVWVWIKYGG